MSWLFSRALVEEYSADNCSAGTPYAPLNVMPTQHKFWRNGKTMEPSQLSLFGLTFAVLTDDLGTELLTWFLAASRARTSAWPERVTGSTASAADSGPKWRGSLARYDPDTRSWRTAQPSLIGGSDEFLETWPRWGTTVAGELYLLPQPVLPTLGNESGFWPTPSANEFRTADRDKLIARRERCKKTAKNGNGFGLTLGNALTLAGETGPVNPTWVEWLMGWPIGWTELEPLATGKCLNAPPLRGAA